MDGLRPDDVASRRRGSSSSTVRAVGNATHRSGAPVSSGPAATAKIWVHDDKFSTEDILINEAILEGSGIHENDLIEITNAGADSDIQDFEHEYDDPEDVPTLSRKQTEDGDHTAPSKLSRYLCLAKFAQAEFKAKQVSLQISIKSSIAGVFGFQNGTQVQVKWASFEEHTASHVEFVFRDAYLARSDMWRLIGQELAGKTIYLGQRITFLGSIKLIVKSIHAGGHKASTAYFSGTTVPIFRSEAARYVVFIQMSREMWDFDSEGNGEILFNRVINGFLPDLFKRWAELEVRHLVSIVLFGRQEYRRFDFAPRRDTVAGVLPSSSTSSIHATNSQDFYKVVVTDMASAQWTTILDELKKDFRVFLRDVSLHAPKDPVSTSILENNQETSRKRITGRLSSAMKGNILEAINIAATQFSNDYVDRDLIRTGISVVVITAGTGVFEVERDLLNLTSENLTNNGIGIDIVCLSKMPLHSVPLFKYRTASAVNRTMGGSDVSNSFGTPPNRSNELQALSAATSITGSPAISLMNSFGPRSMSRYSSFRYENPESFCYGVPQWIDLSYWSSESPITHSTALASNELTTSVIERRKAPFTPQVRMYEVQMMGLMEMGMADISIPFLSETQLRNHKRRRRKKSSLKHWPELRSLSSSPTWSRKDVQESSSLNPPGLIASKKRALRDLFVEMDEYDENIFKLPTPFKISSSTTSPVKSTKLALSTSASSPEKRVKSASAKQLPEQRLIDKELPQVIEPKSPTGSELSSAIGSAKRSPEAIRAARNTSYALRGLAPLLRASASTEVNIENVKADMPKPDSVKSRPTVATTSESVRSLSMRSGISLGHQAKSSTGSDLSPVTSHASEERPTTPIKIKKPMLLNGTGNSRLKNDQRAVSPTSKGSTLAEVAMGRNNINAASENSSDDLSSDEENSLAAFSSLTGSVPKSNVPFVRNVNASNPLKRNPNREAYFGRWQHLYPRKPGAATVKWRSLCTPASVPLTTEDFPGRDKLEEEYESVNYTISLGSSDELLEKPESRDDLYRELLSLRFAHGYQLVVGPRMNKFEGPGVSDQSFFFSPNAERTDGQFIFMSMGNTIQKLSLVDSRSIHVTRYVKKPMEASPAFAPQLDYDLYIRTILSTEYRQRPMQLKGFSERYPWEKADRFLASSKKEIEDEVETLRFWRTRFVLLPVQPPAGAFRPTPTDSEEDEEEIRLRGIRALTQMWQRTRYIPPDERRPANNRISSFKKKDRNPLRINVETLNPSELVTTELDKLLAAEEVGDVQIAQLLPEEEQFERESAPLGKLAAAIQGERGIEIKNRRWHLRLHYSCFVGEEFTNWLVLNFRDVDTRDEAIDLGNELMKEGLFEHVNGRHNFKDGNFFYSIKAEWRLPRADLRQYWFSPTSRKSDRSAPPTTLNEYPSRESPHSVQSRSGSNLANTASHPISELKSGLLHPQQSKRLSVSLSKVIRLDVDQRRKSNRPEIVNLHYDRLHNPENCYHLELSWLNVTSKLVDDAVTSWANQAEKYGLKLVEVPIAEACRVPENEPFRAPYRFRLAVPPPSKPNNGNNGNVFFTATSFTPQTPPSSDKHYYHKQLLKRFNFVLDLEAISEFPSDVEITYSWGKLTYTYTQFIHRSGIILAQITDSGDILLLANRLYNSRLASSKEAATSRKEINTNPSAQGLRPPALPPSVTMQASGIRGLNVSSPSPNIIGISSPITRPNTVPMPMQTPAVAEVFGSKRALSAAGYASYITPEQIKDDLESFCLDKEKLELFYKEVTAMAAPPKEKEKGTPQQQPTRTRTGTSSGLLRPVREDGDEGGFEIPEFKLPEAVTGRLKERKTN